MFRTMARVFEQPNEPTGDSVQMIYSANYITNVWTTYDNENISDEIVYTVYQPVGQTARLYCKYGIAEANLGFDGTEVLDFDDNTKKDRSFEKNYKVNVDYNGSWYEDEEGVTGRNAFWQHVRDTKTLVSDDYVENGKIKASHADELSEKCGGNHLTFGYTYYMGRVLNKDDIPFVFETVFGVYNEDENNIDKGLYSNSGSLFEINGVSIPIKGINIENNNAWVGWLIATILIVAIAVALFIPGVREFLLCAMGATAPHSIWAGFLLAAGSKILVGMAIACSVGALATGANTVALATQSVQAVMRGIEDSSTGYLYSSYGRNIIWENGQMNTYTDSVVIIQVDAMINGPDDLQSRYDSYENSSTSINKLRLKKLEIDAENKACKLPLPYMNCSTARMQSININETTEIVVDKMEQSDLKNVLQKLGITGCIVPKFIRIDNELYQYQYSTSGKGILYPNYKDVSDMLSSNQITLDEKHLINHGGYAYILATQTNLNNHIVPESDTTMLLDNYNIERIVEKSVKHSVSSTEEGSTRQVAYWMATMGHTAITDKGQINGTLKFNGTVYIPGAYRFARDAIRYQGEYYYLGEDGSTYYHVNSGEQWEGDINDTTKATAYFALDGYGAKINVTFVPSIERAYTAKQVGIDTNYYFVIDKDGNYELTCEFGLCAYTNFNIGSDKRIYEDVSIEDLPEGTDYNALLAELPIILYEHIEDIENPNYDGDIDQFFIKPIELTYLDIKKDLEGDRKYINYSISNEAYNKVSDYFKVEDGILYTSKTNDRFIVNALDGVNYVYAPEMDVPEMQNNFINKYVNIGDIEGGAVKLFTRFKYAGADPNLSDIRSFLDYRIPDGKLIRNILLPPSTKETYDTGVIFAESVRVSLSVGNGRIYASYSSGKYSNVQHGRLICNLPSSTQ